MSSADTFDLRTARVNEGLSIRQLSERIHVGRETLRSLERGGRVRPDAAKRVADHFGVLVTDLMPLAAGQPS